MRTAWTFAILGFLTMAGALTYGFTFGSFWEEGRVLTSIPWGVISLLDVYTGFMLVSLWVGFRERSPFAAAAWIVAFMLLGNVLTCFYVILALARSRGDWVTFWMGGRAGKREATAA